MKAFRQIFSIARMEIRFSVRRGGPLVATAAIGFLIVAGTLLLSFANLTPSEYKRYTAAYDANCLNAGSANEMNCLPDQYAPANLFFTVSRGQLLQTWTIFLFLSFLLLPTVTAMSIPADRQFGVSELLRSLPITGNIYLIGKILGVIATVTLTDLVFLFLHGAIASATYGFNAVKMLAGSPLIYGLPILILIPTLGVLIGTPLPSRRSAVIVGLFAGAIGFFVWLTAFRPPAQAGNMAIDIYSYALVERFGHLENQTSTISNLQLFTMGGSILLVLFIVAILARLWLYWREDF